MTSNANLPALQVYVSNSFLNAKADGCEAGTLISVRAQQNQALQFSVLLESGALYTGLPINALSRQAIFNPVALSKAQAYDAISSNIEVITLETLRHMKCTYLPFGEKTPLEALYLFTIDFVETGLARHPIQWKQFHVLEDASTGILVIYPQYRIQFKDGALCPNGNKPLPEYKFNDKIHLSETWEKK